VTRENGAVRAEVANDGKQGRDLNVAPPFTGSGLAGLTERAGALGGQVEAAPWRTDSQRLSPAGGTADPEQRDR
jgi:glucose-6-phosphate-specific signal transduction histidine kinase